MDRALTKISEIEDFRDGYFEINPFKSEVERVEAVRTLAMDLIKPIADNLQKIPPIHSASDHFVCGSILSRCLEYEKLANEHLSSALKLDPENVVGWTDMAVVMLAKPDLDFAVFCLEESLRLRRTSKALYLMSVILRARINDIPANCYKDRKELMERARDFAQEAVDEDPKSGEAHLSLGSSQLMLFFSTAQTKPELRTAAIASYKTALSLDKLYRNPDLHINLSTALRYDEDFAATLYHLQQAVKYDPSSDYSTKRLNSLTKYLESVATTIEKKGKMKAKRIEELLSPSNMVKVRSKSPKAVSISDLMKDPAKNKDKVLLAFVATTIQADEESPLTLVAFDTEKTFFAVTIYNCALSFGFVIGDALTIAAPIVKHIENMKLSPSHVIPSMYVVRVVFPGLLRRNGQVVPSSQVVPMNCTTSI